MQRNTWQRTAVRDALETADAFVSAQQLHEQLRSAGSAVGVATVYRALSDLAADGDADSMQSSDGENLYRACRSTAHHHHLVCTSCGTTVEIAADPVEMWATNVAAEHGFTQPRHLVDVFGLCPACSVQA